MKIKTAELTGAALDWAVALAEGATPGQDLVICVPSKLYKQVRAFNLSLYESSQYSPSTDWSQGGPIIERENIDVHAPRPVWPHWKAYKPEWNGGSGLMEGSVQYGPTLLIAAMRCYVASKLGDEVDVPDELA